MHRSHRARLTLVFACLLSAMACGCTSGEKQESSWWPFGKTSDKVAGITPPPERIKAIRATAKSAAQSDPAEQQRVLTQFADMYSREPDPVIRGEIVRAAGNTPHPVAVSFLAGATKDVDADVRVAACHGLSKHQGPEAAAALCEALAGDSNADVRMTAARALGQHKDPATIAALGSALEDRNPAMQYQAVSSLRTAAPQDLGNDVERWRAYVKGETPPPPQPISVAERVQSLF